ncbi:ATP-binding SpoIIE family protein phosphatase [Streptomyces sp. NPDC002523]
MTGVGNHGAESPSPVTSLDHEDRLFVRVLQQAVRELDAAGGFALVPVEAKQALACVVGVGHPVSIFMAAEVLPLDNDQYAAVVAYRTGRQQVAIRDQAEAGMDLTSPFPYTVVATPLIGPSGRLLGVITFVWDDPSSPHAAAPSEVRTRCWDFAAGCARSLEEQGSRRRSTSAATPRFVLGPVPSGQELLPRAASISFLYQIYRLASRLTRPLTPRGVAEVAVARIMEPFGALCLAISVMDEGRPRMLGYSGCPRDLARRLVGAQAARSGDDTQGFPTAERPLFRARDPIEPPIVAYCLLPLVSGDSRIGTLALGFDRPRHFCPDERATLVTMAALLAQAVERVRQVEAELRLARGLQQGLLPHTLPHRGELDIAARYDTPAAGTAVGGDWYDVLSLPDGKVGLVIGDVEGHSPRAAANMGQIRSAVRAYAAEGHRPADLLERTNRLLADLGTDTLATCCCAWLDPEAETAEIATAGHPAPLLRLPDRLEVPDLPIGIPLGIEPGAHYHSTEVALPEGSTLVLYTDGLVHSHTVQLDDGVKALHQLVAEQGDQSLEALADRMLAITADAGRDDDAALLIAQLVGMREALRHRVGRMIVHRHDLAAVRKVRGFLRDHAHDWGWDAVLDELELATTELVTNALIHADSEVDVRLREYPERLRVEVRDFDPRPPIPAPVLAQAPAGTESEHGRGLLIVDALASSWGNSPSGRGKSVWFELRRMRVEP